MKKLFTLLFMTVFSLTIFVNPVFAGRGGGYSGNSGHNGHNYSGHGHGGYSGRHYSSHGHGHSGHGHINGWEAAAIGLGAAVVGSAIINSYPRERVTVVEHNTYYTPAPPPPPCRVYCYDSPVSYDPPPRVWVPGHYEPVGGGYYRRIPGHWE